MFESFRTKLMSISLTLFTTLFLCLLFVDYKECRLSLQQIQQGYNQGYSDAERGIRHRYRYQSPHSQPFTMRRRSFQRYDYEYEEYERNSYWRERPHRKSKNYREMSVGVNSYKIGYNEGYSDAEQGKRHKYRDPKPLRKGRDRSERYLPSDYEESETPVLSMDYGINEYEEYERNKGWRERPHRKTKNYGNILGIDQNVLTRGLNVMSDGCRQLIKPEFGACIERAANKFDNKDLLSPNNCIALWDLMCCSTELIGKKCGGVEVKAIELGFLAIQKLLEAKGCSSSLRNTVQCSNV